MFFEIEPGFGVRKPGFYCVSQPRLPGLPSHGWAVESDTAHGQSGHAIYHSNWGSYESEEGTINNVAGTTSVNWDSP